MTEERDPLVSRRYRELGGEEPPPALDERILARSRRRRSFQWHGPVAAAAVIVLAVAVTVHVERTQPPAEPAPASAPPEAARVLKEEAQQVKPYEDARTAGKLQRRESSAKESGSRRDAAREAAPQAPPPVAQEAPAERALEAQRAPSAGVAASPLAKLAEQSPERWLQGIAELRAQARHAEADESLKRFRERYPDYRISEELRAKVEKK